MNYSLAIPTYRSNDSLFQLLDSINANRDSFVGLEEILISDNEPTSDLGNELLRRYPELIEIGLKYERNSENLGYDGNLRSLVNRCKSEFIKFIADDDLLTQDFFVSMKVLKWTSPGVGIVLHNFRTDFCENQHLSAKDQGASEFLEYASKWDYEKVMALGGLYGQISTLSFRTRLISELDPIPLTNFIHLYWFFSVFEKNSVLVNNARSVIVRLGSPNFSQTAFQKITIPKGSVNAVKFSQMKDLQLKKRIIKSMQRYCINLLKDLPNISMSSRLSILSEYKVELIQHPILFVKVFPYLIFPKGLYQALRSADTQKLARVIVKQPEGSGIAIAIRDRLKRASKGH